MKNLFLYFLLLFLAAGGAAAQFERTHSHSVLLNYQQIKDDVNYGLVFRGPGLGYAYSAIWQKENIFLNYQGSFIFNVPFSKGITAASLNLTPARFDYLFKTGSDGKVMVGPYALIDYNMETYPDLQSGYNYWFNQYSLGCAVAGWFRVKQSRIDLSLHATFLGFSSRQPVYDDPYFFEGDFGEILKEMHQELEFGFIDSYNLTELEARWLPKDESRIAYAYSFQFYVYNQDPYMKMINNTLKIMILPKKAK